MVALPPHSGTHGVSESNSSLIHRQTQIAEALAAETGISEPQALELVQSLGFSRSSLLFQARALKKEKCGG